MIYYTALTPGCTPLYSCTPLMLAPAPGPESHIQMYAHSLSTLSTIGRRATPGDRESSLLVLLGPPLAVEIALQLAAGKQILKKAGAVVAVIRHVAVVEICPPVIEIEVVGLEFKLESRPALGLGLVEVRLLQITQHRRTCAHRHHLH